MFFQSSYWGTPLCSESIGNFHDLKDTTLDPEIDLRIYQQVLRQW